MADKVEASDDTRVAIPIRNLVSILGAVAVSTWAYSGVIERLNRIETKQTIDESDIAENTEFRIKWPRGEMGSLPADSKQDMNIESLQRQVKELEQDIEENTKWIYEFEPPPEVLDAVSRLRELEIKLSIIEAQIKALK